MVKIVLVISRFNEEITKRMEKKAFEVAKKLKVKIIKKIDVPGAFEIPIAVQKLLKDKEIEGVAALGAVVQGNTYHDVVIAQSVAEKLLELSLKYNKPIGFGIIGPRVSWKDAEERAEEYAERAVKAAIEMIKKIN